MLNIQFISDKKPGARHNEDLFGFKGDTFWLLDGATSTDGPPLARDAHWFVHELDTALNALAARGLEVDALAAEACSRVADRWPSSSPLRPVAALSVWRIADGIIDAAIAGNVSLLVPTDVDVVELTDARVVPSHANSSTELLAALAEGVSFESDEFLRLRKAMKSQEAGGLDVFANTWLASAAPREAADFIRFRMPIRDETPVLAATDGFMELRRFWHAQTNAEFLRLVQGHAGGLAGAIQTLRAVERESGSGKRFPRTKRHDDATAVLLSFPAA